MNTPRHMFSFVDDDDSVCINTTATDLSDLCSVFENYLKACGFHIDGHVTICRADECPHVTAPDDLDPVEDGKEGV